MKRPWECILHCCFVCNGLYHCLIRDKLQLFYDNLMSNNSCKTTVLKKEMQNKNPLLTNLPQRIWGRYIQLHLLQTLFKIFYTFGSKNVSFCKQKFPLWNSDFVTSSYGESSFCEQIMSPTPQQLNLGSKKQQVLNWKCLGLYVTRHSFVKHN